MAQSRYYSSTAQPTVLTGSITPASTTIVVAAVTGFPVSVPYVLALDYATASEELVLVTAAAGTSLTVTRAYDGTSATSHNVAANVRHTWAAADGNDSRFHEGSTGGVHGIAGISAVVGTTDVQILSNKTLTAPIITSLTSNNATLTGTVTGSASYTTPTLTSPTITGTVAGGASYTAPTITSPSITGTVAGGASYTAPTITGNVPGNPTFTAGVKAGSTGQFIVDASGNVSTTGIGQFVYDAQNADQSIASSTVLTASTIVLPVQASARYLLEGFIDYDGQFGGGGGIKCSWTFPAGATGSWTVASAGISGTAPVQYNSNQTTLGGTLIGGTYGTGGQHNTLPIRGWVQTAGTSGNLTFTWAQNTSDALATTVYASSYVTLTRVA